MSLIRRTWVATLILVSIAVVVAGHWSEWSWAPWSGITAMVVTPILWNAWVLRRDYDVIERGAATGAFIGASAQLLPIILFTVWSLYLDPRRGRGLGDLLFLFVWIPFALAAGVGAGAGLIAGAAVSVSRAVVIHRARRPIA